MTLAWGEPPLAPVLAQGHVHVWYWDFHHVQDFGETRACLSEDENTRAARFKTQESKLTFLGSHIFLRHVLGVYLQIDPRSISFQPGAQGRPRLATPYGLAPLQFNLSHSHQSAICAVACGTRVGVDLEPVNPRLCDELTAEQVFSQHELRAMRCLEPSERPEAFFRLWTRKEAYAKCIGLGLSSDLRTTELGFEKPIAMFGGIEVGTFHCPNGYIASLATDRPASDLELFDWGSLAPVRH